MTAAHLHLDEVEDLLLALGVGDGLELLSEAAQHGAAAGLVDGGGRARVRALVHYHVVARNAQPVVQPAKEHIPGDSLLLRAIIHSNSGNKHAVLHCAGAHAMHASPMLSVLSGSRLENSVKMP